MRYDHFTMLPERAFQPRGRGMTLEGGGGGIIGGIVDVVKDVGNFIDDNIIQPIVKDPLSAVATVVGSVIGGPVGAGIGNTVAGLVQGESPKEAITGGVVSGLTAGAGQALLGGAPTDGFAQFSDEIYQGASGTVPSVGPVVPSAFDTATNTALGTIPSIGQFGQTGTAGFGTALPSAADVASGLTSVGFAPGTSANLAGMTAAGTGATNLLGGATALAPLSIAPNLSLTDALRGARLINSLLTPEQQQMPQQQIGNVPQGGVDYSTLLGLLSQKAVKPGLLGTRYQPQPINIASLLG